MGRGAQQLQSRAHVVPVYETRFVGRRLFLERLQTAIEESFAVVLHGPPGVGKSRLANEFARRGSGDVWVADLSDAEDAAEALGMVAAAMELTAAPNGEADAVLARIGRVLAGRPRPRLVLDHVEHLLDDVERWLEHWAPSAPRARLLLTSRVAPKSWPVIDVRPLTEDEAVRLVEDRARRARPNFAVTDENRETVKALIRAVDGLPAAIELLAPRLMLLSPGQLLERLPNTPRDAFDMALQRSWDLLDDEPRQVLTQLAVFRGGFTVELAEAVVANGDVLESLETLVRHAWLHTDTSSDQVRLHLLHEPHRFVERRLQESPLHDDAVRRHVETMVERGEAWDRGIETPDEVECTHRMVAELPNLAAAWERATLPEMRARLGLVLHMAYQRRGPFERQFEVTRQTLEAARQTDDESLQARALLARARALRWRGEFDEALQALEESEALAERSSDAETRCSALRNLAAASWHADDLDATRRWSETALRVAIEEGTSLDEINARNGMGYLLTATDDLDGALEQLQTALNLALEPERPPGVLALVSSSMATLMSRLENWSEAERHSSRALRLYDELGYMRWLPLELLSRAEARLLAGRVDRARDDVEQAIATARRIGLQTVVSRCLLMRGAVHVAREEDSAALEDFEVVCSRAGETHPRLRQEAETYAGWVRDPGSVPAGRTIDQWADPLRRRIARLLADRASTSRRRLWVREGGRAFVVDDGDECDITRRKALRGILELLVERHADGANEPASLDEVQEAGWPGEVMTAESGQRRVYVTIKRLRDAGLGDLLVTTGDGYMLEPSLEIVPLTG
jgi:predicted ATPase